MHLMRAEKFSENSLLHMVYSHNLRFHTEYSIAHYQSYLIN